jgi:maleate cis-trans isomerase
LGSFLREAGMPRVTIEISGDEDLKALDALVQQFVGELADQYRESVIYTCESDGVSVRKTLETETAATLDRFMVLAEPRFRLLT